MLKHEGDGDEAIDSLQSVTCITKGLALDGGTRIVEGGDQAGRPARSKL